MTLLSMCSTDKTSGKEGETYGRVSSMEEIIDIAANWIR